MLNVRDQVTIAFMLSICLTLIFTWVSGLLKWLFATPTAGGPASDTDDEGELPSWPMRSACSFRNKVTSTVAYERGHAWHDLSDSLLLALSVNQMVVSISLWASWLTTYGLQSEDYHVQIASGMSAASALSQFHVPWVLRRPRYLGICMRLALSCIFFALHSVTLIVHMYSADQGPLGMLTILFLLSTAFQYLVILITILRRHRDSTTGCGGCDISYDTKSSLSMTKDSHAMITAIVYLGISSNLSFALGWKYLDPYWLTEPCSSNRAKENEWTFGNILAIGMLVALVLPAFDIQDSKSKSPTLDRVSSNISPHRRVANQCLCRRDSASPCLRATTIGRFSLAFTFCIS